ncbi:MAG: maleylacetoacetate isomerase [Tardiphaga sp.]|nr:maleylacetoacetate isomerase [Tardiphaga sp.]
MKPILHNFFRSSSSYRVRIALAFKGIDYGYAAYHLRKDEHLSATFLALNPQGLLPALQWSDGTLLSQSMAILEFLEEIQPQPAFLPADAAGRARVRSLAMMIACEVHPLNNLRVLQELRTRFGADEAAVTEWFKHWVATTFAPLEQRLASDAATGIFAHGNTPTFADICIVAQIANNARFKVDMEPYPTINRIHASCMELEPFRSAAPARQPDAE